MKYIRKRSKQLHKLAARRLKAVRKQLQKIDLSMSIQINLIVIKITFSIKRREP
ncbi:hypothetical protein SAMN04488118_11723 [Epibacterium ulvae]|uniref:Uncharacterized protein n=1 Tax=Epibacterium ulvae TaxID=1156985 RepID=A0A1G5RH93_9RHOB|nr:hypothetical protein [Epibacterium ulvae]SCZ73434.1 hypothetical protein SAMN04488118_11723 [Epibacterium ulvae]